MATKKKYLTPDHIGTDIVGQVQSLFVKDSKNGYEIRVGTRDFKEAKTDSHVYCAIIGKNGDRTPDLLLDNLFRDDMERGEEDIFIFSRVEHVDEISSLELWRESDNDDDEWFCEYVLVSHHRCDRTLPCDDHNNMRPFPCHQWIKRSKKYELYEFNSTLPQFEILPHRIEHRKEALIEAKVSYRYETEFTGYPRRAADVPPPESQSSDYMDDMDKMKRRLYIEKKIQEWFERGTWSKFDDFLNLYKRTFGIPRGWNNWKSDSRFGDQRLNGINSNQLQRCEKIPENFPVKDEMVKKFIDDQTLEDVIKQKRLFIIDYGWIEGVPSQPDNQLAAPIALFYANKRGELLPIAIQLNPEPAENNPIFLPSDPEYTWMLAKMYFNNADGSVHQSCAHLGLTHMVVESVCCAAHQSLSTSHPVLQLLSPHFLYLIAINSNGITKLLGENGVGGYFDTVMTMGSKGFDEILKRRWKTWRFDVEGWYPSDVESRGVEDKEILSTYYSRDDSLMVHNCIVEYVTDILSTVYDTHEKLLEDYEVQEFASILVDEQNGAGLKGVFGGGKFEKLEDLIKVVSATIFISSVTHAAVNFGQYDEYGFPPNYPAKLSGEMPRDKNVRTEQDIIAHLPDKETTLSTILITYILSTRTTERLGYFEIQYMYEPKAVESVKRFQENLKRIGTVIERRNKNLEMPYPYLHPAEIPNACSV